MNVAEKILESTDDPNVAKMILLINGMKKPFKKISDFSAKLGTTNVPPKYMHTVRSLRASIKHVDGELETLTKLFKS